jgi:L-2-hydroxyglutarate oxidase LhgO
LLGHDVLVLERHERAGMEVSSRNSEVIHAGLYYPAGSLRARLCVEGRRQLLAFCEDAGVPVRKTGKLIVATAEDECAALDAIEASSRLNGAEPLRRLSREEALTLEPEVACVAALLSPGTAVIDTHALLMALEADVSNAGGTIAFNTEVTAIARDASGEFAVEAKSADGSVSAITSRVVVLSAGLGATQVGGLLTYRDGYQVPRMYPAKGHYFSLAGRAPFSHLIYPVPHGAWLGIHLTLDVAGQARFGPDIEWRDDVTYSFDDADGARRARFEREVRRYWPGLPDGALQPGSTGVRPKIYAQGEPTADFAIHGVREHGVGGLVALYGIESPGLTACLAIGDYVSELLRDADRG